MIRRVVFTLVLATCGGCQQRTGAPTIPPETARVTVATTLQQAEPAATPSEARSQWPGGKTRFELTSPAATGIKFVHEWNPPSDKADRLNSYAIGAGVAIGDVDGDGLPDVFLSCQTKGGRLYRNLGKFRFEDVTAKCGMGAKLDGMWATGCSFVDIDGDDDLDLYVCGYDTENRLFINDGRARFTEEASRYGLGFRGASVMMAFADYDCDGDLDGYLLTNFLKPKATDQFQVALHGGRPTIPEEFRQFRDILVPPPGRGSPKLIEAGQYDILYRNDGDGAFTDVTVDVGIGRRNHHGLSATWWDCNSDGRPDLYVANDFFGPDHLYVNNGDGTFADRIEEFLPHVPWFSMGADSADINNDGLFDFLATDMSSLSLARAQVTMSDLEMDAWFLDFARPRQVMRNSLYLNSGANRFMEIAHMAGVASTDWTWSVKFADFDGDGRVDLFVTNGMTRDFQNSDLKEESRREASSLTSAHEFWKRQAPLRETNLVYQNQGDFHFQEVGATWGLNHHGISTGAAYGDLDNDGDLDSVVNNFGEPASVYRNHSQDQHFVKFRLQGDAKNRYGIDSVVRIRANGEIQARYVTISRGFMSSDEPIVHFGIGSATKADSVAIRWCDGSEQTFSDLPGDRLYVVSKSNHPTRDNNEREVPPAMFTRTTIEPPMLHREREYDDFARQPLLPSKQSKRGPGLAYGDVNGDGRNDIYLAGAAGQGGQLFVATPSGFESAPLFADSLMIYDMPSSDAEEMGAVFFDLEGDRDLDLYVVTGGVECEPGDAILQDRLLVNQGNGTFLPASSDAIPDITESGTCVSAADFDRDGDLDLYVGGGSVPGNYPQAARSYLLVNDGGRLVEKSRIVAPDAADLGIVTSALWSDVDNDGWIDLLIAQEWGAVKLFKNEQGTLRERTSESGLAERRGWWNGIAGCDLDSDGDIDYVVTNYGLNTKYRASQSSPEILFYGEFDGSGHRHILEAAVQNSKLFPLRGKRASESAMPMLAVKYPKNSDFASATLEEIYGAESLSKAMRLEANELESGVLMNNGQGHFEFSPLPRLAQISPSFGVQLADFNADGNCDIVLAQNFSGPQRETGRMNGGLGLLLLGEGDGTFEPVWPNRSGVVIPDDARSLIIGDVDHDRWPDFLVGVNDGAVQVHRNTGATSGQPMVVRLVDCPGNPSAVGARVRLRTSSGESQTAEVTAGGSYLAQSGGELFFGLPDNEQVAEVEVRWPDGRESSHARKGQTEWTIHYPAVETGG
jgi:hypothetical protein